MLLNFVCVCIDSNVQNSFLFFFSSPPFLYLFHFFFVFLFLSLFRSSYVLFHFFIFSLLFQSVSHGGVFSSWWLDDSVTCTKWLILTLRILSILMLIWEHQGKSICWLRFYWKVFSEFSCCMMWSHRSN